MSAGIRSGVNWIRLNDEIEDLRDGLDQQRLREAGHARDQAVPAREERDQDLIDDVILADDHLANLGENPLAALRHPARDIGEVVGAAVVHGSRLSPAAGFISGSASKRFR